MKNNPARPAHSSFNQNILLNDFIKRCLDATGVTADDALILRKVLRKAEIRDQLWLCYSGEKVVPVKEEGKVNCSDVDGFLALILKYYDLCRDPKILNGFFKIAYGKLETSDGNIYKAPDEFLKQADQYCERIQLNEGR